MLLVLHLFHYLQKQSLICAIIGYALHPQSKDMNKRQKHIDNFSLQIQNARHHSSNYPPSQNTQQNINVPSQKHKKLKVHQKYKKRGDCQMNEAAFKQSIGQDQVQLHFNQSNMPIFNSINDNMPKYPFYNSLMNHIMLWKQRITPNIIYNSQKIQVEPLQRNQIKSKQFQYSRRSVLFYQTSSEQRSQTSKQSVDSEQEWKLKGRRKKNDKKVQSIQTKFRVSRNRHRIKDSESRKCAQDQARQQQVFYEFGKYRYSNKQLNGILSQITEFYKTNNSQFTDTADVGNQPQFNQYKNRRLYQQFIAEKQQSLSSRIIMEDYVMQ